MTSGMWFRHSPQEMAFRNEIVAYLIWGYPERPGTPISRTVNETLTERHGEREDVLDALGWSDPGPEPPQSIPFPYPTTRKEVSDSCGS